MNVDDYTVEVIRRGRVSVCIQIVEPGAQGVVISRLKRIHPDLKEKVYRTLVACGIPPKWHRYHQWTVISPLTPTNIEALRATDAVKDVYGRLKSDPPLPFDTDEAGRLHFYVPNQQTKPLAYIDDDQKLAVLEQLETVIDKI